MQGYDDFRNKKLVGETGVDMRSATRHLSTPNS